MAKRQASPSSKESRKRRATSSIPTSSMHSVIDSEQSLNSSSKSEGSSKSTSPNTFSQPSASSLGQASTSSKAISKSPTPETVSPEPPNNSGMGQSMIALSPLKTVVEKSGCLPNSQTREPSHDGTVVLPSMSKHIPLETLVQYQEPDVFPYFRSGDIIITTSLSPSPRTFRLHSSVLCRHSPFFASTLQDAVAGEASPVWYSFTIEEVDGKVKLLRQESKGDLPNFSKSIPQTIEGVEIKIEDLTDNGSSPVSASSSTTDVVVTSHKPRHAAAIACYIQIFGTFYSIPPGISISDIDTALLQSEKLIGVATALGCVHLLQAHLGLIYSQYRQKLYVAIKSDPPRWIQLAIALENQAIYTECLIHMVGAYPKWPWPTSRRGVLESIQHLVKQKAMELDKQRIEVDRDLLLISLLINDGRRRPSRAPDPTECNEIEMWLTVQAFRDEIARRMSNVEKHPERTLHLGTLYRGIHKGTLPWLETEHVRNVCSEVMKLAWKDLNEDVVKLKAYAAQAVEKLADNQLMIEPDMYGVGYLTCVKVGEGDVPWLAGAAKGSLG